MLAGILDRKLSLVGVRHEFPARLELIAPRIELAAQASARSKLPLGFRRQSLARPLRVGRGISVGHLDHGVILVALDATLRAGEMPPIRTAHVAPPLVGIMQRNGSRGGGENHRSSDEILRRRGGELLFGRCALGDCDVAGCLHEFLELGVRNIRCVHPEAIYVDAVNWKRVGHRGR